MGEFDIERINQVGTSNVSRETFNGIDEVNSFWATGEKKKKIEEIRYPVGAPVNKLEETKHDALVMTPLDWKNRSGLKERSAIEDKSELIKQIDDYKSSTKQEILSKLTASNSTQPDYKDLALKDTWKGTTLKDSMANDPGSINKTTIELNKRIQSTNLSDHPSIIEIDKTSKIAKSNSDSVSIQNRQVDSSLSFKGQVNQQLPFDSGPKMTESFQSRDISLQKNSDVAPIDQSKLSQASTLKGSETIKQFPESGARTSLEPVQGTVQGTVQGNVLQKMESSAFSNGANIRTDVTSLSTNPALQKLDSISGAGAVQRSDSMTNISAVAQDKADRSVNGGILEKTSSSPSPANSGLVTQAKGDTPGNSVAISGQPKGELQNYFNGSAQLKGEGIQPKVDTTQPPATGHAQSKLDVPSSAGTTAPHKIDAAPYKVETASYKVETTSPSSISGTLKFEPYPPVASTSNGTKTEGTQKLEAVRQTQVTNSTVNAPANQLRSESGSPAKVEVGKAPDFTSVLKGETVGSTLALRSQIIRAEVGESLTKLPTQIYSKTEVTTSTASKFDISATNALARLERGAVSTNAVVHSSNSASDANNFARRESNGKEMPQKGELSVATMSVSMPIPRLAAVGGRIEQPSSYIALVLPQPSRSEARPDVRIDASTGRTNQPATRIESATVANIRPGSAKIIVDRSEPGVIARTEGSDRRLNPIVPARPAHVRVQDSSGLREPLPSKRTLTSEVTDVRAGKREMTGLEIGLVMSIAGIARARALNGKASRSCDDAPDSLSTRANVPVAGGRIASADIHVPHKPLIGSELTMSAILAVTGGGTIGDGNQPLVDKAIPIERKLADRVEATMRIIDGFNAFHIESGDAVRTSQSLSPGERRMPGVVEGKLDADKLDDCPVDTESAIGDVVAQDASVDGLVDNSAKIDTSKICFRPTHLISAGETLVGIAESLYGDSKLGWLIADLNINRVVDKWFDGIRIIETDSRQRLELPVADDIAEFYRISRRDIDSANLITIVNERALDRELVDQRLGKILGGA